MSLKSLFLTCLSIVSLGASRPLDPRISDIARRSLDQPQDKIIGRDAPLNNIDRRDDTKIYDELNATITISEQETTLADAGGYPRLAKLNDGSILCGAFSNENGEQVLHITRSMDDGKSFSAWGEVTRSTNDIGNTFLLQIPSGEILAAIRNHTRVNGTYVDYRISLYKSEDGGRSWAFLIDVAQQKADNERLNGLWEPAMRILSSGQLELTYSGELDKDNQETFRTTSPDGGNTWAEPQNLRLHAENEKWRDGMQNIVPVKDASRGDAVVIVFESLQNDHFKVDYVVSYDDGQTWGNRGTVYETREGFNAGSPQIANIGDNIAVIFGTDEDEEVSPDDWITKSTIKMIFSQGLDDGKINWTKETMTLSQEPSLWPFVLQTEQDNVMAVYGRDGKPLAKTVKRSPI
ncbi:Sialidase [Biscogniauxia marginata]|nr:Sialidase [Biscogniauxia marginata]